MPEDGQGNFRETEEKTAKLPVMNRQPSGMYLVSFFSERKMIEKITAQCPRGNKSKGLIIALPGLFIPAWTMHDFCEQLSFSDTAVVVFQPEYLRWYPPPNGSHDQEQSVVGLAKAVAAVEEKIVAVADHFQITRQEMILLGYSAGAVVALQVAMQASVPFRACVSLAGAILEPDKVTPATDDRFFVLLHRRSDECFKWEERYLPMKRALKKHKYNIRCLEGHFGGHILRREDAVHLRPILAPCLGYGEKP
jgi:predicted esterase